ncbi:hypothetical protein CROQUDRAFT_658836 [Cronartium quercuum f. sp. fusiforme G11]|uniref:Uncharacterized protein n=1 Tax=Cronartium quercuum f. sp. fusiforme G11 TaxID=708437 RepID=A0A9P6NEF1_9BASI|nr:hypothetical protein CROQUDRAFT_658836 [Cronartium quercuum f. sp. fusiforme G11]
MADYAGLGCWDDMCSQPRVKSFAQDPAAQCGQIEWTNRRLDWSTAFKVSTVSALYETRLILVSQVSRDRSTHCSIAESYSLLCPTPATDDSGLYEGVESTTL